MFTQFQNCHACIERLKEDEMEEERLETMDGDDNVFDVADCVNVLANVEGSDPNISANLLLIHMKKCVSFSIS